LGEKRFRELKDRAAREQASQRQTEEIIRDAKQKVPQEARTFIEPLETQFAADMRDLSAKTELGYDKAAAAYLAGEGDSNYKRHIMQWYREMKRVLNDKNDPQAAAKLRAALEQQYAREMIPEWDRRQIAKLLGKRRLPRFNSRLQVPSGQDPISLRRVQSRNDRVCLLGR
jgi:hypothetical protein